MRFKPVSILTASCRAVVLGLLLWSSVFAQGTTIISDPDGISGFELHQKGLFWWLESICGPEQVQAGKISIRPVLGSQQTSLLAEDCEILAYDHPNVVRDDSYVYFFENAQLRRKALNADADDPSLVLDTSPFTPTLGSSSDPSGFLELAEGYIYWSRFSQPSITIDIYRVKVDGSEAASKVLSIGSGSNLKKMTFLRYEDGNSVPQGSLVLLTSSGSLHHRNLTGFQPVTPLATGITDFAIHTYVKFLGGRQATTTIYATKGFVAPLPFNPPPGTLLAINTKTRASTTVFTASGNNQLVSVATDSTQSQLVVVGQENRRNVYVTEARVACGDVFCSFTDSFIRRRELPTTRAGAWDLIVATNAGGNLRSDDRWLYYLNTVNDGRRIQRIATDAPPVEIDFAADPLEVVQSTQSLDQDVRLIARKSTFVRAYAHLEKNTTGQTPWFPGAVLHGFRGGVELPASPIAQLNNAQVDVTTDLSVLRPDPSRSFLFELPYSWTFAGNLRLEVTLNPEESLPETGPSPFDNNTVTRTVTFTSGASPCVVFVPLATTAPLYFAHENEAGFFSILDRAESLLPIERIRINTSLDPITKTVFEVEIFCGPIPIPPFWACVPVPVIKEVPFTMAGDESWALFWVAFRNFFSGDPSGCEDSYWVGTVHQNIASFNGIGGVPGLTLEDIADELPAIPIPSTPIDSSMVVRMDPGPSVSGGVTQPSWNHPRGGHSLAHELGHNFGRTHIDQSLTTGAACGTQTPEGPYQEFPFDPCFFGASDTTLTSTHFGFDPISRQVIAPTVSGDMMSYASSRWISRQTLDATFDASQGSGGGGAIDLEAAAPAIENSTVLLVHGFIDPDAGSADVGVFYELPPGAADAKKVERSLAAAHSMPAESPFSLRLLGVQGQTLAESRLVISRPSDGGQSRLGFVQYVLFDGDTDTVQLIQKGQTDVVLAERSVSGNPPTLELGEPLIDAATHKIRLSWMAADADGDSMSFAVHYQASEETGWQALLVNYPWAEATLDTRMLPGSDVARLRVIASDGVRSTIAVTAPFALARHAPEPSISGVVEGERLEFGVLRELQGLALDAEQGSLAGESLEWSLSGPTALEGAGNSLLLNGLAPGAYTATLTATDDDGMSAQSTRHFEVLPVVIPEGAAPHLDGVPGDAAYKDAAFVRIPLGGGAFARAWMVHSGSDLHVCITDLVYQQLAKAPPRTIGLVVDRNASRDPLAQSDDVAFLVDQNGIPFQAVGNGAKMVETLNPQVGYSVVIERGPGGWSAEMKISDALLGGWNHAAGILFTHNALGVSIGNGQWPSPSSPAQPVTWAPASFGPLAPLANQAPVARAGDDQTLHVGAARTVYLNGTGSFDPDGDALTFAWSQLSGPVVSLDDATSSTPSFEVEPGKDPVAFRFRVLVGDGHAKRSDEVEVTILPASRPGQSSAAAFVRGDADRSGELEITDAIALLGALFLGDGKLGCEDAADSDDNGVIEITDAIKILGYLFLGGSPPPAPGPSSCGLDPSPDALTCESPPICK